MTHLSLLSLPTDPPSQRPIGKAAVTQARTARLATRDPSRLERQISDLNAIAASNPNGLKPKEKQQLEDLERDVVRIKKARDTVGVKDQQRPRSDRNDGRTAARGSRGGDSSVLGKRPRGYGNDEESSDTDPEVKNIPMPRDTPPPIPRSRDRDHRSKARNTNFEPLGDSVRIPHGLPPRPDAASSPNATSGSTSAVPVKRTYEAAPQIRDLRREAIKIVPNIVRQKMEASKGQGPGGKLLEEEDMQRLEAEGYGIQVQGNPGGSKQPGATDEVAKEVLKIAKQARPSVGASSSVQEGTRVPSLEEEEARLVREVEMEEITDEDG